MTLSRCLALLLLLLTGLARPVSAGPTGLTSAETGSTSPALGEPLAPSNSEQKSLAAWLRSRGAIFYGAWWCPACFRQKSLFGQEAGNRLPYVECEKEEAGRKQCQAVDIQAYPTWVLGDQRLVGVQSLEELRRWSGYAGTAATPVPPATAAPR